MQDETETKQIKHSGKTIFYLHREKNRLCTFFRIQIGVCNACEPLSRDMVDGPTFLQLLFPIINVRRCRPKNVDGGQMRKRRRGQINDSFTCSHCKNDGFDAIRGAKDTSWRKEAKFISRTYPAWNQDLIYSTLPERIPTEILFVLTWR